MCRFCGDKNVIVVGRFPSITNTIVELVQCDYCKALNLGTTNSSLSEQIKHHEDIWKELTSYDYQELKSGMINLLHYYSRFLDFNSNMLDIGCGRGNLLAAAKEKFNSVIGCEPSSAFTVNAKINYGFEDSEIFCENAHEFYARCLSNGVSAGAIFFWHTLEHIPNSLDLLKKFNDNILSGDGVLFIQLPGLSRANVFPEHNFLATAELFEKIAMILGTKLIDFSIETRSRFYTGIYSRNHNFTPFDLPIPYRSLNQLERLTAEFDRMLSE